MKLIPTKKNKITFLSRQSNNESLDFKELRKKLEREGYEVKVLTKKMNKSLRSKIEYNFHIYKQMYNIATSKVCVLESYIIPISILKHKKDLYVLQMWHSLGKIKKSGYQTIELRKSTSFFDFENNKKIAKVMCMHKNYDNIIVGGKKFYKYYCEGFNCKKDILLNYGLPRIDVLLKKEKEMKKKINRKYPLTKKKINVLYAPTFRKYEVNEIKNITKGFDFDKYNLIIRCHSNQKIEFECDKLLNIKEYSTVELLPIADYVITDYSAIALEAAVLNKKILYYIFDHDKYIKENGINLDPLCTMPHECYKTKKGLFNALNKKYNYNEYEKFRKDYLPSTLGNSTDLIVDTIIKHMK